LCVANHGGAICAAAAFYCLASIAVPAHARVETLRWAHEDPGAVEFYRVHVGSQSRQYDQSINVGKNLSYNLTLGDSELAFVAVTAHADSTSSGYSNEKRLDAPSAPSSAPPPPSGSSSGPSGGGSNSTTNATLLLGVPLSEAVLLDGRIVQGDIFIHVEPDQPVYKVRFYLDDPKMKKGPLRTDRLYPFDLSGSLGVAPVTEPFDTRTLSDGAHSVTARVNYDSGEVEVLHADFQVQNHGAPPPPPPPSGGSNPPSADATVLLGIPVTQAVPLDGEMVQGEVYIHVEPEKAVDVVRFYLDDPEMNHAPERTEGSYPYDFAGSFGSPSVTRPFDTDTLSNGWHTVTAEVTYASGEVEVLHADFEVRNGAGGSTAPPVVSLEPALLFLRNIADPNAPGLLLQGAQVAGPIFIFVSDPGDIKRVMFYLDDPLRSTAPHRTEEHPAYDFEGSYGAGIPNPFDTRSLGDGTHTVTAVIERVDGSSLVIHADFVVANGN